MKKLKLGIIIVLCLMLAGCSSQVENGVEHLKDKNYKKAQEEFEKSIDKKKNLDEAYRGLGIAYYEQGEFEKARDSFLKALDNDAKETGTIYNFLGVCEMELKNVKKALEYFEAGLEMDHNSYEMVQEMQYNVIVAYERLEQWDKAKEKMEEYLKEYPNDEEAARESEFLETR